MPRLPPGGLPRRFLCPTKSACHRLNIGPTAETESPPGSPDSPFSDASGGSDRKRDGQTEDRFLPIANISRIMKKALPTNAKVTMQEVTSEFISFITGEAIDKCARGKRKTINGDDLLRAMSTLGFGDYLEPLKVYLHKYRETESALAIKAGDSMGKEANGMVSSGVQMMQQPPYKQAQVKNSREQSENI